MGKRDFLKGLTAAQKIDYYANSSNLISVNNGNRKTGIACLTLSFPQCSCAENVPCRKGCYCSKGHQQSPACQGAYWRNWRIWHENPEAFEKQLNALLDFSGISLFRWFDCGDCPSKEFLDMMFRVAKRYPEVSFLAYTKKYSLVNEKLEEENIESRPIWNPMHKQPLFRHCDYITLKESVSEDIFERGLCLPSDIKNTEEDMNKIIRIIKGMFK